MTRVKLMNMCMISDLKNNRVVVQEKVNSDGWDGVTFPGGHVENGESIIDSTIREVEEETGLVIKNLKMRGLVNWYNDSTHERWFVFLYESNDFEGNLIDETHEGKVYWMHYDDLGSAALSNGMNDYLKLYRDDSINEAYATWNEKKTSDFKFI